MAESSCSKSLDHVWAKLVPTDSRYSVVDVGSDEMVVHSEITCISEDKHEWCKITRTSNQSSALIQNKSSSTILIGGATIQREEIIPIVSGTEIIPGPAREGYLCYHFEMMLSARHCEKRLKISIDIENAKCSICLNVWHDVVSAAPCLHNFCNGCFSEWLRRSQERHLTVQCPQCRATVQFVGKNYFLREVVEDILQADASLRRSKEDIAVLNSDAFIQSNLVIRSGRREKRPYLSLDEQSSDVDLSCLQCGAEYGGFRCSRDMVHIQCQGCGGMMPSRPHINVPQHCLGCNRAFCGAYWHSHGVESSDGRPLCGLESFKPIGERSISTIPYITHEKNRYEQDITERSIRQMGRTLQDVISDWIGKFNNREIDRSRLLLNHAEMITATTHVCNACYEKVVSFLLYWFRISMPKHFLPPDVSKREDCWYGYACRTQHRSGEHARKRNHVCRPNSGTMS